MANTCLMLAVITLYYFPNPVHCSFVFVVNSEQALSFDYYSYFPSFFYMSSLSSVFPLFTISFYFLLLML